MAKMQSASAAQSARNISTETGWRDNGDLVRFPNLNKELNERLLPPVPLPEATCKGPVPYPRKVSQS